MKFYQLLILTFVVMFCSGAIMYAVAPAEVSPELRHRQFTGADGTEYVVVQSGRRELFIVIKDGTVSVLTPEEFADQP